MLGVVNLDKPVGPTSHDMVALLRRLTGDRRIGHAGTLDPLASGVLPILVGAATRFSEELTGGRKRYTATIRLGATSDTDDGEGPVVPGERPLPDEGAVREALAGFVGTFDQMPPAFSARKVGGRTAHRAARSGMPLELSARRVTVDAIEVLGIEGADGCLDVRIDLRCGPGTYVRSLARDLGARLGCGGYLAALRRTEAAGLRIQEAVTPQQLEALREEGRLGEAILPVAALLPLPHLRLSERDADRFRNGSRVEVEDASEGGRLAIFDARDELLGIGSLAGRQLQPEKVIVRGSTG
ncbi:MAG TPA: tRNA pseudouridine(55) synthase TruB [Candidatus Limnocylindria bacterium]|jgi:tRNA pseudouridine55 synthase|nr:tRNA pseudouridine(55) synthase TruB [Candidatus Limnocylindria bacterium]